ncbi:hypothetical protein TPHA_0D00970 [Tetrapisispora phaffii CBS 4417]|uniref:ZIP zinc/iron transport family n=1 Tax=Tetrapisispora phaffii (strain ATCC 24235 / CBS 4417 / NBRC 1672 / NRRL Y-8282 / UCD 70-5) TaxID=1071381 RepID=G8BSB7_TETPH|nr:hypothetical protein TPHA_0D00970 [Tetrapisispora phaffii CBS 4417]CCE62738.1 hypothetical protein TPHA_0D00970 [Tetrapisispora phaffii CBS 4417]
MVYLSVIKHAVSYDVSNSELPICDIESDYDGQSDNLRILAVFMVLISSGLGSFFPILSSKYSVIRLPNWCFFIAKFFGSGVITATAFIHLLEPATDELGNDCLGGTFAEYPWAFGICLMSLFTLFLVEIVTHHLMEKNVAGVTPNKVVHMHDEISSSDEGFDKVDDVNELEVTNTQLTTASEDRIDFNPIIGANHYSHAEHHQDIEQMNSALEETGKESYSSQIVSLLILEFGVIFHSIFVGLSLAVSGDEFKTLFVVIIFHQMFEGLGLGSRIAEQNWGVRNTYTPWLLALGFTVATPIAIAIGIGVRYSYFPGSRNALISSGIFDSLSAGILIYTGLVELMAHEFLFSKQFQGENGFKKMLLAYVCMCCGCALMALIGKWA